MAGKGNPMQGYQEATNQLLAINEQRKSNNAQAKMEETLQAAQNNTLAQASEFVATQSPQATVQPANLNPATQNILGQYGLGQPKIQKTSSSSQQVTKQNITINNKNTTITNNNVSVPANSGGPIQGRPIQFQDPGQIKFKTWLSNSFAQQNEQAAKRQREYEKRDAALVRNSNKLMKRLEETGKSIATGLNPKNMASSMGNQLKTLLMVFGFARLAKEWPNLMTWVDKISKEVSNIASDIKGFFSPDGGLAKMLGGKDGEGPLTALKNLFFDKNDGILAYIRKWLSDRMEERASAIKNIPKPEISLDIKGSLGNIVKYLGDILGALVNPTAVATNTVSSKATESAQEYQEDNYKALRKSIGKKELINGEEKLISSGDAALVRGEYRGLTNTSLDKEGNLTGTAGSTIAQGLELDRALISSKSGNLQTATIATGLNRLQNVANEKGSVTLSKDFLVSSIGEEGIKELGLKPTAYSYVARPKTAEELAFDLAKVGEEADNATGWLTGGGFLLGTALSGNPLGGAVLGGAGYKIGELIRRAKEKNIPEYTVDLREGSNPQLADGEKKLEWASPTAYKISKEEFQKILNKITGVENTVADVNNYDFMSSLENSLVGKVQKGNQINKDIDVETLYAPNRLAEQHKKEEQQMWEENRLPQAASYTKETVSGLFNTAKNKVSEVIPIKNVKKVSPSNIDSGDLSGVIEASKRGVFYSDSSGGYIPLGADLSGFMHKCTSGPATFYDDGTGGKIKLNGKWWNTGSPKTATGTNIDKEGFKLVWNGTAEQGWDTSRIKATGFELQPGDIMLNFGRGKNGNSSHAQMWNGEEWISDTHQGQRSFVYRGGGRLGDKSAQIWRYDAGIEKQNIDLASSEVEADGLLDSDDVESGTIAFEGEVASNVLPEIEITPESTTNLAANIPTYNPFDSNKNSSYSPYVSITPESSLSDNYPFAFSGTTGGNNTFSSISPESPNYTSSLNSMGTDVKTMLGILRIMGQTDAQTLEATNNVVSAVGSLRSSGTSYTPSSPSFTDGHYNQSPIS